VLQKRHLKTHENPTQTPFFNAALFQIFAIVRFSARFWAASKSLEQAVKPWSEQLLMRSAHSGTSALLQNIAGRKKPSLVLRTGVRQCLRLAVAAHFVQNDRKPGRAGASIKRVVVNLFSIPGEPEEPRSASVNILKNRSPDRPLEYTLVEPCFQPSRAGGRLYGRWRREENHRAASCVQAVGELGAIKPTPQATPRFITVIEQRAPARFWCAAAAERARPKFWNGLCLDGAGRARHRLRSPT